MKNDNLVYKYISTAPVEIQASLKKIKELIFAVAPEAEEGISYGMPAYKLKNKPLVYFAFYKTHIGIYATPSAHKAFSKELAKYKQGKGSVQFPLSQKIPFGLIKKMISFKAKEIAG